MSASPDRRSYLTFLQLVKESFDTVEMPQSLDELPQAVMQEIHRRSLALVSGTDQLVELLEYWLLAAALDMLGLQEEHRRQEIERALSAFRRDLGSDTRIAWAMQEMSKPGEQGEGCIS